jgi:cytochrome c biogenesis protein CcmG, thiol:disulfide interchange protein DsbE
MRRRWLIGTLIVVAAIAVLAITRGGNGKPKSEAPNSAALQKAFAGSPPVLASIHDQGGELLGGGTDAFKKRLAALKGHPVVVNKWAAWCGPCRQEFPWFQSLSVKYGKSVAFLGVDSNDVTSDAKTFLKQLPVSYPSYSDPNLKIAASMNIVGAFPTTVFYNSQGKLVATHIGAYQKRVQMQQDIAKYAR